MSLSEEVSSGCFPSRLEELTDLVIMDSAEMPFRVNERSAMAHIGAKRTYMGNGNCTLGDHVFIYSSISFGFEYHFPRDSFCSAFVDEEPFLFGSPTEQ